MTTVYLLWFEQETATIANYLLASTQVNQKQKPQSSASKTKRVSPISRKGSIFIRTNSTMTIGGKAFIVD
jgi:hypothetical protein